MRVAKVVGLILVALAVELAFVYVAMSEFLDDPGVDW